MKLAFTRRSLSHAETIDAWWRANRQGSPSAFSQDFAAVLASIQRHPLTPSPVPRTPPFPVASFVAGSYPAPITTCITR